MSEAITKACPVCTNLYVQCCTVCDDTGRVPDVEATLRAEVARLTALLANSDAEIARLRAVVDEWNFQRATFIEGCDSLSNRLVSARAEVARLEGREREARRFIIDGSAVEDCDGEHDYCRECGHYARVCEQYPTQCARAAWLAGCKT